MRLHLTPERKYLELHVSVIDKANQDSFQKSSLSKSSNDDQFTRQTECISYRHTQRNFMNHSWSMENEKKNTPSPLPRLLVILRHATKKK